MAIGDSTDILGRIRRIIPTGWYGSLAPNSDAIIGAISDATAGSYNYITYTKLQTRLATMSGMWLDLFAIDFFGTTLSRPTNQTDDVFRDRIIAALLRERVTRDAMYQAMLNLTGNPPDIFEPWNTNDTAVWGRPEKMAWGRTGRWGNMHLRSQVFMTVTRAPNQGVPNVGGWGTGVFAYGRGLMVWTDTGDVSGSLTDQDIYDEINRTKPLGVIVWVNLI